MNKELKDYSSQELLKEIQTRQKAEAIWFWIDQANCYLATSFLANDSEIIKIGDLFLTREYIFNQKVKKLAEQSKKRQENLAKIFSEINDIEFVGELAKRTRDQPTLKLSLSPGQEHISVTGNNQQTTIITYLPIEIKAQANHAKQKSKP